MREGNHILSSISEMRDGFLTGYEIEQKPDEHNFLRTLPRTYR